MITKVLKVDPENIDQAIIREAADYIRLGQLVAFPTETVYGLGANAHDPMAARRVYEAKGRPSDNPLIVHIAEEAELRPLVRAVPPEAERLVEAFWPGPLTMILPKSERVPREITGGLSTVAVRMPSNPIARALIKECGCPIAAPSANTSGKPSPTEAAHVEHDLSGKIPLILDGGRVSIGIESTIIDLSGERPTILRPGYVTPQMASDAIGGEVALDPAIAGDAPAGGHPKAPGMKYRHYAPSARVVICEGAGAAKEINEMAERDRGQGLVVGVIAAEETAGLYNVDYVKRVGSLGSEETIAQNLYRVLREFDETPVDVIYSESFDTPQMGEAVMNRIRRAASAPKEQ